MIITTIFIVYLFSFIYIYLDNYKRKRNPKIVFLSAMGIPWFIIIIAGTYWGFTEQTYRPYNYLKVLLPSNIPIVLAAVVSVSIVLSYAVAYQVGYMKGYTDREDHLKERQNILKDH